MKRILLLGMLVVVLALVCVPAFSAKSNLNFMMWGSPDELKVYKQIVASFEKANRDVSVKITVVDWDTYWTKLQAQLAGVIPPTSLRCMRRSTRTITPAGYCST